MPIKRADPNKNCEIVRENPERFCVFPIKYHDIWSFYKDAVACFWTPEEIDFSSDLNDWKTLSSNERYFIKNILAFFANADGIVNENLVLNFYDEVQIPEARQFYAFQIAIEAIHCVAPETLVLTDKGHFAIKSICSETVNVWNGFEFSETKIIKTGENDKLLKVVLDNGMELECTEEHKWIIRTSNQRHPENCKTEKILTKDLKQGDVIIRHEMPVINPGDPDEFLNPYTFGFFCGDGGYVNNYPQIQLYGEKQKLLKYLSVSSNKEGNVVGDKIRCYITGEINKKKYFVPMNYSIETKLRFLEGLFDADACVNKNKKGTATNIQFSSSNLRFIKDVQLLLETLGIQSKISLNHEEQRRFLPDGKGGSKEYLCKDCYILYISCYNVLQLSKLGFSPKRLNILIDEDIKANPSLVRIKEVIDEGRFSETYCFNEPKKNYGIFNGILTGQSESYSLMIDTYVKDEEEKKGLFNATLTIPSVKKKADWALKWISNGTFAERLVAFAVVEGVFFSGAFCSIYWLKSRGKMPALGMSNEFISRDEGMHMQFACMLYEKLDVKLSKIQVEKIMREAVSYEQEFITESLPVSLLGMNCDLMKEYIEFVADRLMVMLGYEKIYKSKNPFNFMELISLGKKTNFFERRVTEYARANVKSSEEERKFNLEEDF